MARILLVEDQPLIALHMAEFLALEGHQVLGPAHALPEALALIAEGAVEVALLDLDLAGIPSLPVAAALAARGLPFAFLTGRTPEDVPPGLRDRPFITKPATPDALLAAVEALLG